MSKIMCLLCIIGCHDMYSTQAHHVWNIYRHLPTTLRWFQGSMWVYNIFHKSSVRGTDSMTCFLVFVRQILPDLSGQDCKGDTSFLWPSWTCDARCSLVHDRPLTCWEDSLAITKWVSAPHSDLQVASFVLFRRPFLTSRPSISVIPC